MEQQRLERERIETRLKKINESIAKLEASRDEEISKSFAKFTKTTVKPAPKKDSKQTGNKDGAKDSGSTPSK